jgi:hypothetical protein
VDPAELMALPVLLKLAVELVAFRRLQIARQEADLVEPEALPESESKA